LQKELKVTSPAETNIYFDYFQQLYRYGTNGPALQFSPAEKCREAMKSPQNAKGDSKYYKNGVYKYLKRACRLSH